MPGSDNATKPRAHSYTRRTVRLPRDRRSRWIAGVTAVGALLVVLVFVMSFQSRMQRGFERSLSRDGIEARLRAALAANAERPIPPEVLGRLYETIRLHDGKTVISREELE